MDYEEARSETIELFGEDSFTESDDGPAPTRFYVGACPTSAGRYCGFMGYSWEEALNLARLAVDHDRRRSQRE